MEVVAAKMRAALWLGISVRPVFTMDYPRANKQMNFSSSNCRTQSLTNEQFTGTLTAWFLEDRIPSRFSSI
jgi:hypothetical protein